jgi:hypothetical protein
MAYALMNQAPRTYSKASGELIDWTYYDTETLVSTTTQPILFQTPASGAKTLDLTNMRVAGQIPMGQHLTVHAIRAMYLCTHTMTATLCNALNAMLAQTTLEIKVGNKDSSLFVTLQEIFGNCMLETVQDSTNVTVLGSVGRYHGIYPLNSRIALEPTTTFQVNLVHYNSTPNSGLNSDLLKIGLSGKLLKTK